MPSSACKKKAQNHPNICTIHDAGEQDGPALPARDVLQGGSEKHQTGTGRRVVNRMLHIGLVHDEPVTASRAVCLVPAVIKPSTLFVTDLRHSIVLYFGLARFSALSAEAPTAASTATVGLSVHHLIILFSAAATTEIYTLSLHDALPI